MKSLLNQTEADAMYEALLDAHAGLDAEQSALLNARLILLLAYQIGDARIVADLVATARKTPELAP